MSNKRRVMRMARQLEADVMATHHKHDLPDWAGIAWMLSPYYCRDAHRIMATMGDAWTARAKRIIRAMEIASEWRMDQQTADSFA